MREFTLLIDSNATMDGLEEGAVIRGSGMMGASEMRIIVSRRSGGGFRDEGHMLHVRADDYSRYFDDQHGFNQIRYGTNGRHEAAVTQTRRLR